MVALLTLFSTLLPIFFTSLQVAANPAVLDQLLTARQSISGSGIVDPSDIPSACQSKCTPLADAFTGCTDVNCICSDSKVSLMVTCLDCVVGISGSSTTSEEGQAVIDQFVKTCAAAGITIKSQKVSGSKNGALGRACEITGMVGIALGAMVALA